MQGRKLRVEYKKVLQAGEKERIEREKAIRRMRSMQLEKEQQALQQQQQGYDDFGTVLTTPFTPQRSFSASNVYQSSQYSPPQMPPLPTSQSLNVTSSPLPAVWLDRRGIELVQPGALLAIPVCGSAALEAGH